MAPLAAFTGNKSSTDTLIQTFSSALRVAPEGIKADNIVLDVPSLGTLTGNGVIAGDNSLDFKMLLKPSSGASNMLGSLTGLSASAQSKGLPFLIEGRPPIRCSGLLWAAPLPPVFRTHCWERSVATRATRLTQKASSKSRT